MQCKQPTAFILRKCVCGFKNQKKRQGRTAGVARDKGTRANDVAVVENVRGA
jgi:hypothetical protein